MKIEFKITETFNSIIAQLESGEIKGNPVVEIFDHKELIPEYQERCSSPTLRIWEIRDSDFNSTAVVRLKKSYGDSNPGTINIHTALSGYKYEIFNPETYSGGQSSSFGKSSYCSYEGAFRGLLEQNLLPYITPEFTGSEEVESSLKWCTLTEYCKLQKKFAEFRKDNDAHSDRYTYPRAIFEWLKNLG